MLNTLEKGSTYTDKLVNVLRGIPLHTGQGDCPSSPNYSQRRMQLFACKPPIDNIYQTWSIVPDTTEPGLIIIQQKHTLAEYNPVPQYQCKGSRAAIWDGEEPTQLSEAQPFQGALKF